MSEKLTRRKWETQRESPFYNEYGGLHLVIHDSKHYMKSESLFSSRFYGPLTPAEVGAFNMLCDVKCLGYEENKS